jgi:hypothetical protein
VAVRDAGRDPLVRVRRPRSIDPFLPKIEEWVDRSHGKVRADVVHDRLVAMGFGTTDRTTRRGGGAICTFQALREQLRGKEIWVVGADKWRNPDQDLPHDFEAHRDAHYAALRKPLDPTAFIDQLRGEMRDELAALDTGLPKLAWLEIADRG